MEKILNKISANSTFCWLLVPVFFLLKNSNLYFGAIPGVQIAGLFAKYLLISIILYFFLYIISLKSKYKASLSCFVILVTYFFYAQFDSFLQRQQWLVPFNRYRWSLPICGLIICITLISIYRLKETPKRLITFLNALMILFCLSELIPLTYKSLTPKKPLLTVNDNLGYSLSGTNNFKRPDIYFLLFDEYQGNKGLQMLLGFDNEELKAALKKRNFFAPSAAQSNYNYTFFSMPSIFNMEYIQGNIQGKNNVENLLTFSSGVQLLKNSNFIKLLKKLDYGIVNLSPFKLDDTGKNVPQFGNITLEKDLIEMQTLSRTFGAKMGEIVSNKWMLRFFNTSDYNNQYYTEYIRSRLVSASASPHEKPVFVYSHFFIPHSPFLKDSAGNDVDFKELNIKKRERDIKYLSSHYISYIKYTNSIITSTVDTLLKNDPGAVIILMSDHGLRQTVLDKDELKFNIQFYVKEPQNDYSQWPDSLNAVNTFRILLNNQFDLKLDYLPYKSKVFNQ